MADLQQWYEVIEGSDLLQGDFFPDCPIVLPPDEFLMLDEGLADMIVTARTRLYNVVVMSQSCDLMQRKLSWVLVCPHWSLNELETMDARFKPPKMKEEVRRGHVPAYHMLSACDLQGFEREIQIVDFRTVVGVPFEFLTELARRRGPRLRLLSPYREHLSQAFARFFMRVGLPADIPPFK
jgi:hypothetical protein